MLTKADIYMESDGPKAYMQQLAVASEALRRAQKVSPAGGQTKDDLLGQFRAVFNETEAQA